MKRYLIDTNVLILFFTKRNFEQYSKVIDLFQKSELGECHLLFPFELVSEFVYVMKASYSVNAKTIRKYIDAMNGGDVVEILFSETTISTMKLWPDSIVDFGDAMLAYHALQIRHDGVLTFDKKLQKQLKKLSIPIISL